MTEDQGTVRRAVPSRAAVDLRTDHPHTARIYDYMIGGKTNFPADRRAAEESMRHMPGLTIGARANRSFLRRCVYRLAADHGVRQFLDVGTGIPTSPNTHEIAQGVDPTSRIVYVDNDPIVLTHARALMSSTPEGATAYVDADLRRPEDILGDPELRATLDLDQPVALMMIAILHFVDDGAGPYDLVRRFLDALAPGSFLALTHATKDIDPVALGGVEDTYRASGMTVRMRSLAEFSRFFDGLDILEPGPGLVTRWWPDAAEAGLRDKDVSMYGAVARTS